MESKAFEARGGGLRIKQFKCKQMAVEVPAHSVSTSGWMVARVNRLTGLSVIWIDLVGLMMKVDIYLLPQMPRDARKDLINLNWDSSTIIVFSNKKHPEHISAVIF